MYLISASSLAISLRQNTLSERAKMHYLLLGSVMLAVVNCTYLLAWLEYTLEKLNAFDHLADAVVIIFQALIVLSAFNANAQGDNRHFIERFICLSVPVTVRVSVIAAFLAIPLVWTQESVIGAEALEATTVFDVMFTFVFSLLFLWQMRKYMRIASGYHAEASSA